MTLDWDVHAITAGGPAEMLETASGAGLLLGMAAVLGCSALRIALEMGMRHVGRAVGREMGVVGALVRWVWARSREGETRRG